MKYVTEVKYLIESTVLQQILQKVLFVNPFLLSG